MFVRTSIPNSQCICCGGIWRHVIHLHPYHTFSCLTQTLHGAKIESGTQPRLYPQQSGANRRKCEEGQHQYTHTHTLSLSLSFPPSLSPSLSLSPRAHTLTLTLTAVFQINFPLDINWQWQFRSRKQTVDVLTSVDVRPAVDEVLLPKLYYQLRVLIKRYCKYLITFLQQAPF